jgi:hypothetical protein
MPDLNPARRSLQARLAAHHSWANTPDRAARTSKGRRAFFDRFVQQARKKYGELPPDELARRADHLMRAHFASLALRSAKVRAKRAAARTTARRTTARRTRRVVRVKRRRSR